MAAVDTTPVLADREAQRRLRDDGYVVVDFLDRDEVAQLRAAAERSASDVGSGLVIDFTSMERSAMRETAALLDPVWERHLPEVFVDHEAVVATFIVKFPGPESEMVIHHEPTYLADGVPTYNVWIPLVDVGPGSHNGCLRFVPRSHHLPFGLVGFNTPPTFRRYRSVLQDASVALHVPAGAGLIYDSRTVHWSEANSSSVPRPAVAAAVGRRGVPLVHVVATGRRTRHVHTVDRAFFLDVHPVEVNERIGVEYPDVELVEEVEFLTPASVGEALGLESPPSPETLLPLDIAASVERDVVELVDVAVTGVAVATADVGLSSADLAGGSPDVDPGAASKEGGFVWVPLADPVDAAVAPADLVGDLRELALQPDRAAVLVVDPGVRVPVDTGAAGLSIATYDAPDSNAGVLVHPASVATFTPGRRVALPADSAVTVWNDGPGPAWLVVDPA